MTTQKEYIKTFVIRIIKGKVDKSELQQVRQNLLNYSREDWQDLKIIGKELAKEVIDEQFNKEQFNQMPEDWKGLMQDLSHSWVNLFFAIFNEEVLYQNMLLEKQGAGLDEKTKILKILPVFSRSMDQVVARIPSNRPSNYWKAEKSLVAKTKKIFREVEGFYLSLWGKELSENRIKAKMSKLVGILESLSVEEIAVFKDKSKTFVNRLVDNYAPPQIKNYPEIRQLINSLIDLWSASVDEKLVKDSFSIAAKVMKFAGQNEALLEGESLFGIIQKAGVEEEVKNMVRGITQRLNKLAGEGEQNNNHLSAEREEDIIKRFNENNSTSNQEDASLEGLWKDNLLTNSFSSSGGNLAKTPTQEDLQKIIKDTFLVTQSKPKWYQNPWFIGFSIVGGMAIGGLIVWLLMRRKKERKVVNKESNF